MYVFYLHGRIQGRRKGVAALPTDKFMLEKDFFYIFFIFWQKSDFTPPSTTLKTDCFFGFSGINPGYALEYRVSALFLKKEKKWKISVPLRLELGILDLQAARLSYAVCGSNKRLRVQFSG